MHNAKTRRIFKLVQLSENMSEKTLKVSIEIPEGYNIILGHTHFIKSVEDIYEAMVNSSASIKFGIGFCEASQDRLVRGEGNDDDLKEWAMQKALKIGAGHTFLIVMKGGYPINVMNLLKSVPEICTIHCATANPLQVLMVKTEQGRGIIGVVDGFSPVGMEKEDDVKKRKKLLRDIGYKL